MRKQSKTPEIVKSEMRIQKCDENGIKILKWTAADEIEKGKWKYRKSKTTRSIKHRLYK